MKKYYLYYEILMALLAIISVAILWIDNPNRDLIDKGIWLIFLIDVSVRFFNSKSKIEYIKKNPFDIIAIIPLDNIFRTARLVRLIRILRLLAIVKRSNISKVLKTNNLDKVLVATTLLIFLSAIPVKKVEPGIETYGDAIWWAIVTTTTVGYGDISPVTGLGRFIALILMIFGIGLLGMITGSIATFFIGQEKENKNSSVEYIKKELDRVDELTANDIDTLIILLEKMKENKKTD